jgi:outer membrane lipoprotein carrier protein
MKIKIIICLLSIFGFTYLQGIFGWDCTFAQNSSPLTLDEIINRVEQRYEVSGFMAHFVQESTIKAMEITDVASGRVFVKRPRMMRWEYDKPEKQIIVTDGKKLWIYRPEDNQVMVGQAPSFFGDGKGAGFLADIKVIRSKFSISLPKQNDDRYYTLRLLPLQEEIDLSEIYLSVSKRTFKVDKIVTYNPYGDETRIDLINSRFDQVPDAALFTFDIPEGVDVLNLE